MRHLDMAKIMLATGLIVAYGYIMEAFMAWYSGSQFDSFLLWNRLHGPYQIAYLALLGCNIFIPQVLWLRKVSRVHRFGSGSSPLSCSSACGWSASLLWWSA